MVNQHHPLTPGAQQMIPGQNAHDFFLAVQNGIAGMAVFQHYLPDVVHPVVQMEADQILGLADAPDRVGLEQQAAGPVSIEGCGNNDGFRWKFPQLHRKGALAQHQAADVHFQRPAHHVRLMAAEHDGLPLLEQQILLALGQGDHHLAGDGVRILPGLVEDFSFQHGQQIKQRHLLQHPGGDAGHIVTGNVRPGENAVQGTVLVGHRHRGDGRIGSEFVPGQAHGNPGA